MTGASQDPWLQVSVNRRAQELVRTLCENSAELRVRVSRSARGARLIDAGIEVPGLQQSIRSLNARFAAAEQSVRGATHSVAGTGA